MQFDNIRGFLFDLDGVITDTAALHAKAWAGICQRLGIPWTDALAEGTKGVSRMDSLEVILKSANRQDEFSMAQKAQMATEKNDRYQELITHLTASDILPGMKDFITDLKQHNYQLALASASRNAPTVLKYLGLSDVFPKIVDPSNLTKGKPDPEIYQHAAALLNLEPGQCIGVEDAPAGVASIKAAGAIAVGIGDAHDLAQADVVFPGTASLTLPALRGKLEDGVLNA